MIGIVFFPIQDVHSTPSLRLYLARVNGGEMILNTTQQGRLWNTIQQGTTSSSAPISGAVKFHIEGKQLVGVLNNYNSSKSRL